MAGEGTQGRECGLLGRVPGDVRVETGVAEVGRWGEVSQDVFDIEVRSAIDETFRRRHGWEPIGRSRPQQCQRPPAQWRAPDPGDSQL